MKIIRERLKQVYAEKTDAELLKLHASGNLDQRACEVIEAEMLNRNIGIPERTPLLRYTRVSIFNWENDPRWVPLLATVESYWDGKNSLFSAFWIIFLGGTIMWSWIIYMVYSTSSLMIIIAVIFVYLVFSWVSVWRCAWNTRRAGWGYVARAIVSLTAIGCFYWIIKSFS